MSIEDLKKLLTDGKITQEQFDQMALAIDPNYQPEPVNSEPEPEPEPEPNPNEDKGASKEELEKLIQSAVDRATNKIGNENKKLKEQLDTLKKSKLSDEEKRQLEAEEKEREIEERERAITEKENRLYAIKAIKEAGLDDGSNTALSLIDFVIGEDEAAIDDRIKTFKTLFDKMVKTAVDRTFKKNGGAPEKGSHSAGTNNPYAKDTFNLTEQMKLESENPELAKQLKIATGIR